MYMYSNLGDDLLEFHQAVMSTLHETDDTMMPLDPAPLPIIIPPNNPLLTHTSEDMARLSETHNDLPDDIDDDSECSKLKIQNSDLIDSI